MPKVVSTLTLKFSRSLPRKLSAQKFISLSKSSPNYFQLPLKFFTPSQTVTLKLHLLKKISPCPFIFFSPSETLSFFSLLHHCPILTKTIRCLTITIHSEILQSVLSGTTASYKLEAKLGDCRRAATIRHEALERTTGSLLKGLPLDGLDYESILGQCCENPVGYVQIPSKTLS
ncbi:unnamed protein product [Prunus brigantina]